MNRWNTLLRREWMQHHKGWWILMLAPPGLILLAAVFGNVSARSVDAGELDALAAALLAIIGTGFGVLALGALATLFQAPGLARRDVQDRSIEFWLSLPASHAQSIGATLLMHLFVWPALALAVGLGSGIVISLPVVAKTWGLASWFTLPWGSLALTVVVLWLRLCLGLVLALLWLSPLILGTMAASAWLKRWGVPAMIALLSTSALILRQMFGVNWVRDGLQYLGEQATHAMLSAGGRGEHNLVIQSPNDVDAVLSHIPGWLVHDAGSALAALATPGFLAALAGGALAFGLLVLRRQRGA